MIVNHPLSIGQALKDHWTAYSVPFNNGVSKTALESFQRGNNVILPPDLQDYFLKVDGMKPDASDNSLIRFWMLRELKTLPECAPEYGTEEYVQDPNSLFPFADFSLWSHAYAVRLTGNVSNINEVLLIGWDTPVLLFESFTDFVQAYLRNQDFLFPKFTRQRAEA